MHGLSTVVHMNNDPETVEKYHKPAASWEHPGGFSMIFHGHPSTAEPKKKVRKKKRAK